METAGPRPAWLGPGLQGLGAVYLPQLAVFLFGPVQECAHCVRAYLQLFPVLPGLAAGMAWSSNGARLLAAGAATLVLFAGVLTGSLRLEGHKRLVFLVAVAVLATLNALGASAALRA